MKHCEYIEYNTLYIKQFFFFNKISFEENEIKMLKVSSDFFIF